MKINKRSIGGFYEKMAADYLKRNGLHLKVMNYRCRAGEIDLIMRDGDFLVFVEVKYRKSDKNGDAAEAVGYYKRKSISKVAKYFLMTHYNTADIACRFDVVAINDDKINWIKNAFEYTE